MRSSTLVLVLAGLAGLVACGENPTPTSASRARLEPGQTAALARANVDIPGEYIVRFRDSDPDVDARIRALGRQMDGSVEHTYRHAVKGFFVRGLSDAAASALRKNPDVVSVEPNREMAAMGLQTNAPWAVDRLDQRSLPLDGRYSYGADGSGVTVYLIDSGINFGHVEFGGRASLGVDLVTTPNGGVDCNGHGTHIAGIAGGTTYGVAKRAKLVAVRVLDCYLRTSTAIVIAGVDWVTAHRTLPAVANLSLGGAYSATVNAAITRSIASGVVYTIASGNSTADACLSSPSSTPDAITVSATDIIDRWTNWTNVGPCVDIAAPGENVMSAWIGSPTAIAAHYGTSMAAPHVAGAAAMYLQAFPNATPAQVTAALTSNAIRGALSEVPAGSPNLLVYTGFITGSTPPPPPPPQNQPPAATINSPANGASFVQGATVTFSGSGTDPEDGVLSGARLAWTSSRDGAIGSGTSFSTAGLSVGTHGIVLTATDSKGATATSTVTISIVPAPSGNRPPVASFVVNCSGQAYPHQCTFDASSSTDDVKVVSYVWDWGNGRAETKVSSATRNTWASSGTYTVSLTVRDGAGLTSSISRSVQVP